MHSHETHARPMATTRRGLVAAAAVLGAISLTATSALTQQAAAPTTGVKAITFDVQGTLVDYYAPFARVSAAIAKRKGAMIEWRGFLADWNNRAAMGGFAIVTGKHAWVPTDQLLREALDATVAARGLETTLDDRDRLELMSVWGQMVPWPDSAEGLAVLRHKATVAALSNAGMAATIFTAKRTGLTFDAVLSGELVHAYKPSPEVYRSASAFLGVPPGAIMMVAAHKTDLKAAKAAGFRTAYIPRPGELGPDTKVDRTPEAYIDFYADSVTGLARKLDSGADHAAN